MNGRLHPKDEALLRRLSKDPRRPQWFTGDTQRIVDRLLDIGFIRRTRDGVVITPVGILYCMMVDQIADVKCGQNQAPLFGDDESEKKTASCS